MGLLGAIFGGTVGFMFGGPLGAMIGGTIGAQMDQSRRPASRRIGQEQGARQDVQSAFLVALISLAAKVSKADGQVSEAEIRAFDHFLRTGTTMDAEDRRHAARIFNEARDSSVPASAFARQIRTILGNQPDRLRDLITLLLQIAHADGELHPAEDRLIGEIAKDMGLSARDYETCKAFFGGGAGRKTTGTKTAAPAASDYEVLGVNPSASNDEVKKAYRQLARDYHPDTLQSKGLPEDFMTFATEKIQKVNEAYDRIKTARGM